MSNIWCDPSSTSILRVRTAKALARLRRLAWAFAGHLCDKYHNLMSWLISYHLIKVNLLPKLLLENWWILWLAKVIPTYLNVQYFQSCFSEANKLPRTYRAYSFIRNWMFMVLYTLFGDFIKHDKEIKQIKSHIWQVLHGWYPALLWQSFLIF